MSEGAGNDRSSDRGEPEPHGDPAVTVDHFNALETARDLEAAGIERPHAEAIARAVGRAVAPLATKADIQRLENTMRGELQQYRASTNADSERLETTVRGELQQHGASTKADSERLETTLRSDLEQHGASTKADSERLETTLRSDLEQHGASAKADSERLETTLRSDLEQHGASTKADSERLETTLRGEFERRMDRHEARIRAEFANFRAEMYRALWIQGAGIVAIVAALKLLP